MTEQNEDRDRLVCILASANPAVPSVIATCIECDAPVWRSRGSLDQDFDTICLNCVPVGTAPMAAVPQIVEAAQKMGMDPLELANHLAQCGIEIADG